MPASKLNPISLQILVALYVIFSLVVSFEQQEHQFNTFGMGIALGIGNHLGPKLFGSSEIVQVLNLAFN